MQLFRVLAGLAALAAGVQSRSTSHADTMEYLWDTPEGWYSVGSPDPNQSMLFRIAMSSPNRALWEQSLAEISDPFHSRYGQYMKRDQLKNLLRPSQGATDAVLAWLQDAGISQRDIQEKGDWINFRATVAQAEKLMDTTFEVYRSYVDPSVAKTRTLQYSVPQQLHSYIDMIQPTTRFGQIRPLFSEVHDKQVLGAAGEVEVEGVDAACGSSITPACLQQLYNIKGFTPSGSINETGFLGVNGFLKQYARFDDLAQFERLYATFAKGANFTWTSVNGGILDQNSSEDSTEANLDIQYTLSLSYPLPNNFYSTPGLGELIPDLDQPDPSNNQNEPYLDFFTYLNDLPDGQLPHTLTTSYGEDEQSVPAAYAQKVCDLIGQLGSRGVSVIFSSGDTGVGSACQTNDGKNTTRFLPIFPAACPYVTSVGGVSGTAPESAVGFSSGGFSDRWPQPEWQATAVNTYLKGLGSKWAGLYNPAGRGFPDIAAQAQNYHVIENGADTLVGGTSASAPTVAAIIALLNAARLKNKQPPLGFLNPWLYKTVGPAGALNDITNGGSSGCTGRDIYSGLPTPKVPNASWKAVAGWDPVTGLGTPDFSKLLPIALKGNGAFKRHLRTKL
jgi:tripeptidyl-peptidase-1